MIGGKFKDGDTEIIPIPFSPANPARGGAGQRSELSCRHILLGVGQCSRDSRRTVLPLLHQSAACRFAIVKQP